MIWVFIYSVLLIFMLILFKAVLGTIKNPIGVFCILWCVIGIGSNAALYDYYAPAEVVNYMIIIAIMGAFLVYCFSMHGYSQTIFLKECKIEDGFIHFKRVLVINLLAMGILFPYMMTSVNKIRSGGFAFLRAEGVFGGGFYAILFDSVIRPLFTATTILAIVYSFTDNRKKEKIILLSLVVVANIEQVILSAGRTPLVNFLYYIIIAVIMFRGRSLYNVIRKERKYIFLVLVVAFLVLKLTSKRNMSSRENLLIYNSYVYYFSGPSYLTQLLEQVHNYGIGGILLYGGASFGFISNIWSDIMIFITGKSQGSLYLLGSVITNNQYKVGAHTSINAMYTCFYPFLIDFGWLGIVLCPICIGIVSAIFTKKLCKKKDIFTISLYIYWTYVLIHTVFKWDLVNIDLTVIIVSLWFFTNHRQIDEMKDKKIINR